MSIEGAQQPKSEVPFADRILTPEQYVQSEAAHRESPLHVVNLEHGPKHLVYVGVSHSNDPESPIFAEIEHQFKELKPTKVYFEGWEKASRVPEEARRYVEGMTLDETKRDAEPIYVLKLAVDAGIAFESPELNDTDVYRQLRGEGFTDRELFFSLFYSIMQQYLREHREPSVEGAKSYLAPFFNRLFAENEFNQTDKEQLIAEAHQEIDITKHDFYKDQSDPMPWPDKPMTRSKEIARWTTMARDRYALQRFAIGLAEHDRVLIVYGRSHAISLEPALKALMDAQ